MRRLSLSRGEPFNTGIDAFTSGQRSRRAPCLDECRSPFAGKLILPSLAVSRKGRAGTGELAFDGSAKSSNQSARVLNGSRSLPSLLNTPVAIDDPDVSCKSDLQRRHSSCSRRSSLNVPKKDRSERVATAESPYAASPGTSATATPSTALDSPPWQGMVPPSVAGTTSSTPSASSTGGITPSPVRSKSKQNNGLRWRQGEEIGAGSYGHVYTAQCKSTGHIFAVKVSRITDDDGKKLCDKLQQELDICKNLRHRHIVACMGHEFVNRRLYIYLEYVPGGSVRRMINEFGPLEGQLLVKATRGILKGLNYLHKQNPVVVHRDLKGANVLIDLQFCVKLADFGCSKCDVNTKSFSKVGSIHWVAPEVLQDCGHGRKADIWSFACVINEMATAADPWGAGAFDNILQAMKVIACSDRLPPIPDALPDSARSLVRRCLQRAPEDRPGTSDLLRHQFFQDALRSTGTPDCCFSRPNSKSGS